MNALLILATCLGASFTVPDSALDRYEGRLVDQYGVVATKTVHRDSTCNGISPTPKRKGERERVYFSVSDDGKARLYYVRSVRGGKASGWSNPLGRASAALRDTGYMDLTRTPPVHLRSMSSGDLAFVRAMGDTLLTIDPVYTRLLGPTVSGPVVSLREFLRLDRPKSCFVTQLTEGRAYWIEAGVERPCP